jgi:hypothetical protein
MVRVKMIFYNRNSFTIAEFCLLYVQHKRLDRTAIRWSLYCCRSRQNKVFIKSTSSGEFFVVCFIYVIEEQARGRFCQ